MSNANETLRLDRQLGQLTRLIDDAILKILSICDVIDLLRVERTCKYLRFLTTSREVWLAVLLRLPPEAAPSIAPHQKREEAEFRKLAVNAVRAYENWTSKHPKPSRRIHLDVQQPESMRSDLRLLPGERYMIYFRKRSLFCFDILKNTYVLERKYENPSAELLSSVYEINSDSLSAKIFVLSVHPSDPSLELLFEIVYVHFVTGQSERIYKLALKWTDLCKAAEAEFVMLNELSISGTVFFVPYTSGDFSGQARNRGGILVNWIKNLILILSFQDCDPENGDSRLPSCISNDNLFYISMCRIGEPVIHSVSLSHFDLFWQKSDEPTTWLTHTINPGHGIQFSLADHWTTDMFQVAHMHIHPSNWLDLEMVRLKDPSIVSLSLVDVGFFQRLHTIEELASTEFHSRLLHLHFSKSKAASDGHLLERFSLERISATTPVSPGRRIESQIPPTRQARLTLLMSGKNPGDPPQTNAVALLQGTASSAALAHMDSRSVRHAVMEYYSSALILSSVLKDSTKEILQDSAEFVIEYYD
ncbi:hypothetical protein EW145_g6831 [Phellinidium pouzarii]|uniref:F-box domain-containing protein n=1 Tax=Phellinidium pouzarii TaxID=167371 RepID=A0A4S4KTI3_9AGAM|nr:hypothetical protein EW145_g6831 [Phellinidium pouzarii]